jgi:hypothetical protein
VRGENEKRPLDLAARLAFDFLRPLTCFTGDREHYEEQQQHQRDTPSSSYSFPRSPFVALLSLLNRSVPSLPPSHTSPAPSGPSPAMVQQRPRPTKSHSGSSRLGRLAKLFLSLYLVLAIFYTAYHLLLRPSVAYVSGGRYGASSSSADSIDDLSLAQQPKVNAAVDAAGKASASTTTKQKHAALETAGVKAADIRNEDPVWAAAEAADKKGKKKGKDVGQYVRPEVLIDGKELVHKRLNGFDAVDWDKDQMVWHHPEAELAHSGPLNGKGLGYEQLKGEKTISEDHFLSLSFSSSLQPSKVIPYYYRASDPDHDGFNKEDITITTLVTSNRFTVFERLVERYQGAFPPFLLPPLLPNSFPSSTGPISATVHVSEGKQHGELLQSLEKLYTSSPLMKKYVDIHLVYDNFDRQFNMWRNVAKFFARTEVRFSPPPFPSSNSR